MVIQLVLFLGLLVLVTQLVFLLKLLFQGHLHEIEQDYHHCHYYYLIGYIFLSKYQEVFIKC